MKIKNVVCLCAATVALLVLGGCGDRTPQIVEQPTQKELIPGEFLGSDNFTGQPIERMELTDPILYSYLKETGDAPGVHAGGADPAAVKRVNKLATIGRASRQGISGNAIITESAGGYTLEIKNFNYDGSCGPITFALGLSSQRERPIYQFNPISGPLYSDSFEFPIPSSVQFVQFDSLFIYCPTDAEPVSVTRI